MLVVLPPSEAKAAGPPAGPPIDLAARSFSELNHHRSALLDALAATSALPDACTQLTLRASMAAELPQNLCVRDAPTMPAIERYAGDLYQALDATTLPAAARRRVRSRLVIASSLWGLLRPADRIPAYRLPVCAHLVGMAPLEPAWRPLVTPCLDHAAGTRGVVVDCRSSSYLALGSPARAADRTAVVRVVGADGSPAKVSGVVGKRVRGLLARYLLELDTDPTTPQELTEALTRRWTARVVAPPRQGRPWTLEVAASG